MGFSFGRLDHAPGDGTLGGNGGWGGGQKIYFSEIQPNLVCDYSYEWHVQRHNILGPRPLGPWGGAKRLNIIKFQLQSQFQRFLNQTLCERYKTYHT